MFYLKKIASLIIFGFIFFSFNVSAAVSNCRVNSGPNYIQQDLTFEITSSNSTIATGTQLASATSSFILFACDFTGTVAAPNHIYFKNIMPTEIKTLLINSGVTVTQRSAIGGGITATITNPSVPNLDLGYWNQPATGVTTNIAIKYNFSVNKGSNTLKPFDTGSFILGYHEDYQAKNLGVPVYAHIIGNLTLLCPTPAVNLSVSHGGSIEFDTVSPKQMNAGESISRPFHLMMAVPPDCATGLNVSVRFEPNNNTILGGKYLDMGNGLQTMLQSGSTEINYNQNYVIGEILPQSSVSVPYTAILNKVPGSSISSGPFSKTIRAVVSY
ncbi:fimbrial protein [Morganella morganii]|nr:fimbrial protein [Morganella morganii]